MASLRSRTCYAAAGTGCLALLLLAAGCGRQASASKTPTAAAAAPSGEGTWVSLGEVRPLLLPGESMAWSISYLGVEMGRARLAVGEPGELDGRRVVQVVGQAESSGLAEAFSDAMDHVTSWVDAETGAPVRTESELKLNNKHIRVHTDFEGNRARQWIWRADRPERRKVQRLPEHTQDSMTALLLLRGWGAPERSRTVMYVLGGSRLWKSEIVVEGREVIDTALGRRKAVRISSYSRRLRSHDLLIDESKPARLLTVWMSDDADRVPLRVVARTEYGQVEMNAVSYQSPPTARR